MSILSDVHIKESLSEGSIIIEPYNPKQLGNCSYDVRLGENYCVHQGSQKMLNPWSTEDVKGYWAVRRAELASIEISQKYDLEESQRVIVLQPGQLILAHTEEFIGGVDKITTMIKARSSMGRCGISICKCAGWGDVGYFNRFTLEIENHAEVPVVLLTGQCVAQVVFMRTGEVSKKYSSGGNYQTSDDLATVVSSWSPESMLPKTKML